jgi:tRNA (guanine37-N1)-methyltransferase
MALTIDIITIFPRMLESVLGESIIARARRAGLIEVRLTDLRDYTTDRHRSVDDRPYGGGPGMVFKPEPVFSAVEAVLQRGSAPPERTRKILLSPQGRRLVQADLWSLASAEWIVILSGRYEGFDERIRGGLGFEEISIGDYILSGGEVPAMVILEGVVRLIPGALGDADSPRRESFEEGCLEFPQYTRPPEFRGMKVPEVLTSGDHGRIERWRAEEALKRTRERRQDLLRGRE